MLKDIINHKKWSASMSALVNQFIEHGGQTIAELSKNLGVSVPYTTKTLNELIEIGLVQTTGKRDNYSKRAPKIYDLIATSGYFLGIDTGKDNLTFGICDFCGNMIADPVKIDFDYKDSLECFETFIKSINSFIEKSGIDKSQIKNACMSIGGRVNPEIGCAYNYFSCLGKPLAETMSEKLGLPFCIDNDTRCMTYGESLKGVCKGIKNVIFVNVSWGIGIGIIIDGKLYYGKSGYSGEFGHMTAYNNNIICHCGKIGCIETEVSGRALKRKLVEKIKEGKTSILSERVLKKNEDLSLQDILDAIAKEDVLSLATLQRIADELGKQLAGVINIFNPEMLVIGGEMSVTGDYLTLPVKMGIKKFSLNIMNEDSKIVTSSLKGLAGITGACLMARYRLLNENIDK